MEGATFFAILFIGITVCSGQRSAYDVYYDEAVSLLQESEIIIPEGRAEFAALIPGVRCQQRSSAAKDIPLALRCMEAFAPRLLALVPVYYPYPKLQLIVSYCGALLARNQFILSKGVGTTADVDESYKSIVKLWRVALDDLKSTKGTALDNIYNSVIYLRNLCQREIRPSGNCNCNGRCIN